MTLTEWVSKEVARQKVSRRDVLMGLYAQCGVSYTTLSAVDRGARMGRYDKAQAIEKATGGKVTVKDLCDVG